MDHVNGRIIFSTLILMAAGVYRLQISKGKGGGTSTTLTRVLVGGYILALVASVIDLAGGPASEVSGLLMALAVFTALLAVLPDLFQRITQHQQQPAATQPGGGSRPTVR